MEGEEQIVHRAKHGDLRAFHELIEAHGQYAFGVAYKLLGSTQDAEDVVQETFLAALKSVGRFEGRSSFRTWLIQILARQAALYRRKRPSQMRLAGGQSIAGDASQSSDTQMDVSEAIGGLPDEHRQILVLRELEHMDYQQLATVLGIPKGTVESRLYRARQMLKAKLRAYEDESKK